MQLHRSTRPRGVRRCILILATAFFTGCASLPKDALGPPSAALPASTDTRLGRIAQAGQPDADLTGFRLMPSGGFALDARLGLARRAERTLDLQYYQIENDETGRYLMRVLRDAARRGVRVRLLMDDLYTGGEDELLAGLSAEPNVEVRLFNPFPAGRSGLESRFLASLFDFDRVNRRMHNKLFIADGAMAVAGGRNIGNQYFTRTTEDNFVDLDTFVTGALVPRLAGLFDGYWNSPYVLPAEAVITATGTRAERRERFEVLTGPATTPPPEPPAPNDVLGYGPVMQEVDAARLDGLIWALAEAYADSPDRVIGKKTSYGGVPLQDVDSVRYNVLEQMRRARSEVVLTSPYLVPGKAGLEVLNEVRQRGVKLTLVTNSLASTDEPVVHTGYRRYRRELLKAGVELHELSSLRTRRSVRLGLFGSRVGRLHAKTAVIDGRTLYVGSMNFDPRSEIHNTEIGLIVHSREMAAQVRKLVDVLMDQGAYRVRLGPDGESLEWVDEDAEGGEAVLRVEPESRFWDRLRLELLAPLVPEGLL